MLNKNNDNPELEEISCNCCNSTELKTIYTQPDEKYFPNEWFTVVECRRCGLGFCNPRPTKDNISRFYPPHFFDNFEENDHSIRYHEEWKYLKEIQQNTKAPTLLDIGCANGDFPRYMMKQGWKVTGVEIAESAKHIDDFKIYHTLFPAKPIPSESCDAVTAWAVLEHVHDPMSYFQKVADVLKDNGQFVFLVTNFNSMASRHLFAEDIPRHLFFFTPTTIHQYLRKVDLHLTRIDFHDKIFTMKSENWLTFLLKKITNKPFRFEDRPRDYSQYLKDNRLQASYINKLKYCSQHPIKVIDHLLLPAIDRYSIVTKQYAIMVCVAQKLKR